MVIRDTYRFAIVSAQWHRYLIHVTDEFSILALGVLLLALIVISEYVYRTGVQEGALWLRFSFVSALQLSLISVFHSLHFIIELSSDVVDPLRVITLLIEWGAAGLFWQQHRRLLRRSVKS
jgi:hypothetical protein